MAVDWFSESDPVPVARGLLKQILEDGSSPLNLRLQLKRTIWRYDESVAAGRAQGHEASSDSEVLVASEDLLLLTSTGTVEAAPLEELQTSADLNPAGDTAAELDEILADDTFANTSQEGPVTLDSSSLDGISAGALEIHTALPIIGTHGGDDGSVEVAAAAEQARPQRSGEESIEATAEEASLGEEIVSSHCCHASIAGVISLSGPDLALIAARLPLAEVLALRATSSVGVEWAMHRAISGVEELKKVHDRIRARLWIQRVSDLTKDTEDETMFETQVRSFANDALRRRMEAEMIEAKVQMERQIHAFQGEVDRRMEEQALRVHAIVEERVQHQLDAILAAEMEKVRAMVEERVQERVRSVVRNEVRTTVCEVHARLTSLTHENDCLRAAFIEQSGPYLRYACSLSPGATGLIARALRFTWLGRRCCTRLFGWLFGVPDSRRERMRAGLEVLRRTTGADDGAQSLGELRARWGPEDARRLLLAPILAGEVGAMLEAIESQSGLQAEASSATSASGSLSRARLAAGLLGEVASASTEATGGASSSSAAALPATSGRGSCTAASEELYDDEEEDDDNGPPRLAEPPEPSEDEGEDDDEEQPPALEEVEDGQASADLEDALTASPHRWQTPVADMSAAAEPDLSRQASDPESEDAAAAAPEVDGAAAEVSGAATEAEAPIDVDCVAPVAAEVDGEADGAEMEVGGGVAAAPADEDAVEELPRGQLLPDDGDLELQRVLLLSLGAPDDEAISSTGASSSTGPAPMAVQNFRDDDAADVFFEATSDNEVFFEDAEGETTLDEA